jgi:hypothetical protein
MQFYRPFVELSRLNLAEADEVNQRRTDLAVKWKRQHGNKGNVTPAEQLRGVRAEVAARIYFDPVHWNAVSEAQFLGTEPDLVSRTIKIEVKSIGNPHYGLIAYKGEPAWAFVLLDLSEFPGCWVSGWLWGRELMALPKEELQPGRPCWRAKQERLRDPADLRNRIYDEQFQNAYSA